MKFFLKKMLIFSLIFIETLNDGTAITKITANNPNLPFFEQASSIVEKLDNHPTRSENELIEIIRENVYEYSKWCGSHIWRNRTKLNGLFFLEKSHNFSIYQ